MLVKKSLEHLFPCVASRRDERDVCGHFDILVAWLYLMNRHFKLIMCKWYCLSEGPATNMQCLHCGTRYCQACIHGEAGKMSSLIK